MFDFDKLLRVATAAVGALVLTTVTVGAAVGPAEAGANNPFYYAQVQISDRANG